MEGLCDTRLGDHLALPHHVIGRVLPERDECLDAFARVPE